MTTDNFNLADVRYVHRIVIGTADGDAPGSDAQSQAAMYVLNRCLSDTPRGRIIGLEKSVQLLTVDGHQLVRQGLVYHVGFNRRPSWLAD
ncbi:hypothetical protein [Nitrospirillum iridis]|uniref:Uncharacterized protein n=1 Tax=Nitrospirillum iridis TaxID=765888 RepID=A0A7X0AWB9_9PROT|nr:hypothetical protein [Nitrospirillum iridis]MBB6251313.1 hypothetical protein [Nitrospirillum iridis]